MSIKSEEKILKVLEVIKGKTDLASKGTPITYRAGQETLGLTAEEEILILNRLKDDGVIEIMDNFSSEYE